MKLLTILYSRLRGNDMFFQSVTSLPVIPAKAGIQERIDNWSILDKRKVQFTYYLSFLPRIKYGTNSSRNHDIFQAEDIITQYSNIPSFHYSKIAQAKIKLSSCIVFPTVLSNEGNKNTHNLFFFYAFA